MMMPKKPYHRLRGRMYEYGCTQDDVADYLGRSKCYINKRFNRKKQFELSDVYGICKMLEINPKEICSFFPETETQQVVS